MRNKESPILVCTDVCSR